MAKTNINPSPRSRFPRKYNKRESRLASTNFSAIEIDSSEALESADNVNYVFCTAAAPAVLSLPKANESTGRVVVVRQTGTGSLTLSPAAGDSAPNPTLDQDEWIELFCDGSAWRETRSNYV